MSARHFDVSMLILLLHVYYTVFTHYFTFELRRNCYFFSFVVVLVTSKRQTTFNSFIFLHHLFTWSLSICDTRRSVLALRSLRFSLWHRFWVLPTLKSKCCPNRSPLSSRLLSFSVMSSILAFQCLKSPQRANHIY